MKQADELDVFEAASYYAETADSGTVQGRSNMVEKEWREERGQKGHLLDRRSETRSRGSPSRLVVGRGRSTRRRKRRVSESSLFVYSSRSPCKVNVDKKTHHKSWRRGPSKAAPGPPREVFHGGRSGYGDPLREGGRRVSINGMSEKDSRFYCESLLQFEERSFWRRGEEEEQEGEDGSESDSSSDLFDLPNYELVRF
ncbi:unnamed protein product [Spirodela intermedia]|uniref:Uncharacterized protein n=1 Tax=Spirodela intermedia TaxID=51605 RepID=A0A7I8IHI6_SPIIN|nr:unnamed protein product [Spirodela intermedia]CAA6657343.1 unnamed protein product [Spirodela intermedia]